MNTTPAYDLATVKAAFCTVNRLRITLSARQGAVELGFSDQDIVDAIQALKPADFYKTMAPVTPGFAAMQDVYRPTFRGMALYIKFQQLADGHLVLSFKAR